MPRAARGAGCGGAAPHTARVVRGAKVAGGGGGRHALTVGVSSAAGRGQSSRRAAPGGVACAGVGEGLVEEGECGKIGGCGRSGRWHGDRHSREGSFARF